MSLQLCLLAKCFKPVLPFLEMDMMDICKENGAYDAKHFLCYYYYGGMIYTGLKNFERALYFYEQVLLRSLTVYTVLYIVSHHKIQTLFLIVH